MRCGGGKSGKQQKEKAKEEKDVEEGGEGRDEGLLVSLTGKLVPLASNEEREFVDFVTDRPHKFLLQHSKAKDSNNNSSSSKGTSTLVFASWRKYSCNGTGAMRVDLSMSETTASSNTTGLLLLPVLATRFPPQVVEAMDLSQAMCFVQPEYKMVDYTNTPVDW